MLNVTCNIEGCDAESHLLHNAHVKFVHNIEEEIYYATYVCPQTGIRESYQLYPGYNARTMQEIPVEDLVWESRKPYLDNEGRLMDGAEYVQTKNPAFSRRPTGFPPITEIDISAFCAKMEADDYLAQYAMN